MSDGQEESLRNLIVELAKNNGYEAKEVNIEPISTEGANYTSKLYRVKVITVEDKTLPLFAKVATIGEALRNDIPVTQFYETERFVYQHLEEVYCRLEEQSRVPDPYKMYFPIFYGCNPKLYEETIVLEDLTAKGYTTHDRLKSIDWNYARAAVKELAKFHALSFAYEYDDPEEFAEVLEKRKYEIKGDENAIQTVWKTMIGNVLEQTREENREKFKKYLSTHGSRIRDHYKPLRKAVLTHGDYRPSNLMHRTNEKGEVEIVPVDYQTVRTGSIATDLLYLIYTGTDAAFRKEYYEKMIQEYYDQLTIATERLSLDIETVYSRRTFDFEMDESLPYALSIAVFILPIVTVEAANAPKLDEMDLTTWHVKSSNLFPVRLNEIVDEFVELGII